MWYSKQIQNEYIYDKTNYQEAFNNLRKLIDYK